MNTHTPLVFADSSPMDNANRKILERLTIAAHTIRDGISWRRKREASHNIYDILKEIVSAGLAFDVAVAMTGVKPEPWSTATEALNDLDKLGVKVYYKKLRRLYRKAIQAGGELTVALNASGKWDSPDSTTLADPLAILRIRVHGDVHFRVSQFGVGD